MLANLRRGLLVTAVACWLSAGDLGFVHAGPAAAIVSVGDAEASLEEVQRQLTEVPGFQLASLGDDPHEIREQFVQRVIVPKLLLSQAAAKQKLDTEPRVQQQLQGLLVRRLEEELRQQAEAEVESEDVRKYFEARRSDLDRPERIRLYRLLVSGRPQADKLLAQAKGITDMAEWRKLVREHSLDKATHLRGGDIGFVRPDGTTDVPRVRVSAELYDAAAKVRDGELVPEPIAEGKHYAILWRRGTLAAEAAELQQEAPRIRRLLSEAKVQRAMTELVARLSKGTVKRHGLELLEELELPLPADPRRLPTATIAPVAASAHPEVRQGDTGLR